MPVFWMVTYDGVPLFKGIMHEFVARAKAEKWQGERYKRGLLKHGDKGDHIEVKRDTETERDWDIRYADMKAGKLQRVIKEEYIKE